MPSQVELLVKLLMMHRKKRKSRRKLQIKILFLKKIGFIIFSKDPKGLMLVNATLSVHAHSGDELRYSAKFLHVFHEFACDFKPNELELTRKEERTSFRHLTLIPCPFDDLQLEGFDESSSKPVVLFKFEDSSKLQGFMSLAASQSCTVGKRTKFDMKKETSLQFVDGCKVSQITDEKLQHNDDAVEIVRQAEHQN